MNAIQAINAIVKKAQHLPPRQSEILKRLEYKKPIDWFDRKYQTAMNGPERPFDFNGEAMKILKPFRQRVGQHGADELAREFSGQLKDMRENPGKYGDADKRRLIGQWKDRIAQFDRNRSNAESARRLTQNRQAVPAPKWNGAGKTGWTGRSAVQGGSAPTDTVDPASLRPRLNVAKTVGGQNYFDVGGGKTVAYNDLPSTRMQWWNRPGGKPPSGWGRYVASYSPRQSVSPMSSRPATSQVAQASGDDLPAFGDKL